jgi:hypothetical protein
MIIPMVISLLISFLLLFIPILFFIIIPRKKKKQRNIEISKIKDMHMSDLLRSNDLEEYCEIFAKNKIENIEMAIGLSESDLMNMGISILGDRRKLLSLFNEQETRLNADETKLVRCRMCRSLISSKENICPHCGKRIKMTTWFKIIIVLFVIGILSLTIHITLDTNTTSSVDTIQTSDTNASNDAVNTDVDSRNRLAYTSWEPRPRPNPHGGVQSSQVLDFEEDTFVGYNIHGIVVSGEYTVSGNTVTFIGMGVMGMQTGKLSGGRLIIGDTVFYKL